MALFRELTFVSFNYVETDVSLRKVAIETHGNPVLEFVTGLGRIKTMTCGNNACPFHDLQAIVGAHNGADLACRVTNSVKQVRFDAGDVLFAQGELSTRCLVESSRSPAIRAQDASKSSASPIQATSLLDCNLSKPTATSTAPWPRPRLSRVRSATAVS